MKELEKLNKLAPIFKDCIYMFQNTDLQALECANRAKLIALEFAKSLMETKIRKYTSGRIGESSDSVEYTPSEYDLMRGDLIVNGDSIFNKFIEEHTREI